MILSIQLYDQNEELLTNYSLMLLDRVSDHDQLVRVVDSNCRVVLEAFEGGLEIEQGQNQGKGVDIRFLLTNGDTPYSGDPIHIWRDSNDYEDEGKDPVEYTFTVKGEDLATGIISSFKRRLVISITNPKKILKDRVRSVRRHKKTVVGETKLITSNKN